jgi:hypothetical protein
LDVLEKGTNTVQAYTLAAELSGIGANDLDGNYFKTANYVLEIGTPPAVKITATGFDDAAGKTVVMTKATDGTVEWSGTLLD